LYYIDFLILLACPADPEWIGDGDCDDNANSEDCQFDGGDCCPAESWIGDGSCDDETNIEACYFDGGDCCLDNDNITLVSCTICLCHETGIQATLAPGGTFLHWLRYIHCITGHATDPIPYVLLSCVASLRWVVVKLFMCYSYRMPMLLLLLLLG
jgi:hypothetical protein